MKLAKKFLEKKIDKKCFIYRQDSNREGPKGLAAPPTAHMAQVIFSLPVAVDTIGGYNWRHRGDFWISI